jgi:hypothetical protein
VNLFENTVESGYSELEKLVHYIRGSLKRKIKFFMLIISRVQIKSWAGKALETVNCCDFLKRRLIGAC